MAMSEEWALELKLMASAGGDKSRDDRADTRADDDYDGDRFDLDVGRDQGGDDFGF